MTYIYCLRHPVSMDIFYVGKTKKLTQRLKAHISNGNTFDKVDPYCYVEKSNCIKSEYISSILKSGNRPAIQILETIDFNEDTMAAKREQYWIDWMGMMGWELTNGGAFSFHRKNPSIPIKRPIPIIQKRPNLILMKVMAELEIELH